MSDMLIKEQTPSARCEICHQSDCYDASTNHCSRCATMPIPAPTIEKKKSFPIEPPAKTCTIFLKSLLITTAIIFFVATSIALSLKIGLIAAITAFCLFLLLTKILLLQGMPANIQLQPISAAYLAWLDQRLLDNFSQEVGELGFEWLGDYQLKLDKSKIAQVITFCRLYQNPATGSTLELLQSLTSNINDTQDNRPMRITISTQLTDNWLISTTNREPDSISYILSRPRKIRFNLPGKMPAELMTEHLAKVNQIAQHLKATVLPVSTFEEMLHETQQDTASLRKIMIWQNILLQMIDGALFERNPKYQWLGEYEKIAAKQLPIDSRQ